ncbi:MAG: D-amino-acid transaminase [Maricaulaceae bacterium]
MARIAYVNGRYRPLAAAQVRVEDRGFQFADGVYEVWSVRQGRLLDTEAHFDRLERSLRALQMAAPMGRRALSVVVREIVRRNRLADGSVYLQITRGPARREHRFPSPAPRPTLVLTAQSVDLEAVERIGRAGVRVKTMRDIRWGRCDIKTVGLLANVLAKQSAFECGASEAWLTDAEGCVTEGASSTAWIVEASKRLVTRHLDAAILPGVTRRAVSAYAADAGFQIEERAFTVAEALAAQEAFITSASTHVTPVTHIDDQPVAGGRPGPVALALRALYARMSREDIAKN